MHTYIIDISAILSIPVELYQNNQSSAKVPTVLPPVMYIYQANKSPIVSKEKGKGGKKKGGFQRKPPKKKTSGAENAAKKERTENQPANYVCTSQRGLQIQRGRLLLAEQGQVLTPSLHTYIS